LAAQRKNIIWLSFDLMPMNPKLPYGGIAHPWIFGSYAVYTQNLHVARRVYEQVRSQSVPAPFGTIELETGETIDWINMGYGVGGQGRDRPIPLDRLHDV